MTLQSRLLGVFAQYKHDPRVGIFTTAVIVRQSTGYNTGLVYANQLSPDLFVLNTRIDWAMTRYGTVLLNGVIVWETAKEWVNMISHADWGFFSTHRIKYESVIPWVARTIYRWLKVCATEEDPRKGKTPFSYRIRVLMDYLVPITDWVEAAHPNLMPMTLDQAITASQLWHEEQYAHQCAFETKDMQGEIAYVYSDGWTVQKLTTPGQLRYESHMMRHCVGNSPAYLDAIRQGFGAIYSIRDAQNTPVITIEITKLYIPPDKRSVADRRTTAEKAYGDGVVTQAKLRFNAMPATIDICDRIVEAGRQLHWIVGSDLRDWDNCDRLYRKLDVTP